MYLYHYVLLLISCHFNWYTAILRHLYSPEKTTTVYYKFMSRSVITKFSCKYINWYFQQELMSSCPRVFIRGPIHMVNVSAHGYSPVDNFCEMDETTTGVHLWAMSYSWLFWAMGVTCGSLHLVKDIAHGWTLMGHYNHLMESKAHKCSSWAYPTIKMTK